MAFIQKQDTNGTKAVLLKGELGYDDYTVGGDTGRVYVGNGTTNEALSKKAETDLLAPKANPTFTGTVTAPIVDTATLTKSSYNQATDATLGTGTHTFDFANGDAQELTMTGDVTIAFSNFTTGKVCSMIIDAVNWGAWTPTYPTGMLFSGGAVPTLTAAGRDKLMVVKDKDDVYELFVIGTDVKVVV
jgi:hypothetical protein